MNPQRPEPDNFSGESITIQVLAHANEQLKHDLAAMSDQLINVTNEVSRLRGVLDQEQAEHDKAMMALAERVSLNRSVADRKHAQLVALAMHLPFFLAFYVDTFAGFRPECLTLEVQEALRNAKDFSELLKQFLPEPNPEVHGNGI